MSSLSDPTPVEDGPPNLDLLSFDRDPDFAALELELRVKLRAVVDKLMAAAPNVVFKFGSCYERRFPERPNNQAQYNKEYFDNSAAEMLVSGVEADRTAGAAEKYVIAYAKHHKVCVNDRREGPRSIPRNPKRGDKGFHAQDPGCIYAVPTRFKSEEEFRAVYVSYYHKRKLAAARVAVNEAIVAAYWASWIFIPTLFVISHLRISP
ncbi:hypothetical protein ACHAXT_007533 [Thalassiosira profunda]